MFDLLNNPFSLILALITILSIIFYLREYNLRRKIEAEGEKMLGQFRQKGLETLHQSIKKSQDIIGEAELEGVKMVADTRYSLSQDIKESQNTITSAQAQLIDFMANLQKRSQQFEEASRISSEQRINEMFARLETRLSDFLVATAQKTTSSIELELRSTRQLIDTYKSQQLKLIDENIIAMMEQTLNIVLGKKLSLKEQLDLIYEALEKAKVEKFIV